MAGSSSVRVIDQGAENILLQWFEECNDSEVDEDVTANSTMKSIVLKDNKVHHVVQWTNAEGQRKYGDLWKNLDYEEFLQFVGLLTLVGLYKFHNEDITILWNVEYGRPIFNRTMSRSRFTTISQCLRFDNAELPTLQNSYIPYENLTVDEQLLTFRSRCLFKQFIPSKPEKYGIKIWAACGSQTLFIYNCQIYIDKTGDQRERNQGKRVVLDMTKGLETSERNVTTDNFLQASILQEKWKRKI
ncbi:hypothetical protein ILUMI_20162 [Ignelater luminosus]|uniref:PiggyBac transposable element-derived protein domain-containing protein n=1 Tax=Ignelater luminosus TaxID=2038154 RepID=A0A8K0CHX6_IGNLU|nr:hypothetical protein ILUMI_20162 [Ignelater luminosus]